MSEIFKILLLDSSATLNHHFPTSISPTIGREKSLKKEGGKNERFKARNSRERERERNDVENGTMADNARDKKCNRQSVT